MKELRYTLVSDGSSDRALIPILNWLLQKYAVGYAIQPEWADLRRLPQPIRDLTERIRTSLDLYPCDLLFVHRDAENISYERRVLEIEWALRAVPEWEQGRTIGVIPVRMTEAWLLIDEAALREAEDQAILHILDVQRQVGVDVYSDGEYRRGMWMTGLPAAVAGFVPGALLNIRHWRGQRLPYVPGQTGTGHAATVGQNPAAVIGGKLVPKRRITAHESAFLVQHAPGPYKITIPSPTWYLRGYIPGISDQVYPSRAEALADLTTIVHQEVNALVEEGVPYVQIDSIRYVFDYTDEERRRAWQALGIDPDQAIAETIAADNAVIAGLKRQGVTLGLHMCRGNNRSRWFAEGGYDRIAEQAFSQLNYDRFLLEYDSERAGGFAPLRFVPKGKTVVLGLISTKVPALESMDDLLRRIDEAATYVPVANLALSPQCGFASVAAGNEISWDDQRRKLERLVDVARRAFSS